MFIIANEDELIDNKHSKMLINFYGGKDVSLKKCHGSHNDMRPEDIIRDIGAFFYKHLVNDSKEDNTIKIVNKLDIFDMDENYEDLKNNIRNENDKYNIENKQNNNEIINNSQNDDNISDIEEYLKKIEEKN